MGNYIKQQDTPIVLQPVSRQLKGTLPACVTSPNGAQVKSQLCITTRLLVGGAKECNYFSLGLFFDDVSFPYVCPTGL